MENFAEELEKLENAQHPFNTLIEETWDKYRQEFEPDLSYMVYWEPYFSKSKLLKIVIHWYDDGDLVTSSIPIEFFEDYEKAANQKRQRVLELQSERIKAQETEGIEFRRQQYEKLKKEFGENNV